VSFVKSFVFIVVVLFFFNHKVHNGQHRVLKVVLIFIKNLKSRNETAQFIRRT